MRGNSQYLLIEEKLSRVNDQWIAHYNNGSSYRLMDYQIQLMNLINQAMVDFKNNSLREKKKLDKVIIKSITHPEISQYLAKNLKYRHLAKKFAKTSFKNSRGKTTKRRGHRKSDHNQPNYRLFIRDGVWQCTCPKFQYYYKKKGEKCKHIISQIDVQSNGFRNRMKRLFGIKTRRNTNQQNWSTKDQNKHKFVCRPCGNSNLRDSLYCVKCGSKL